MKLLKNIRNRFPKRLRPNSAPDGDILAELEFHLEMRTQENLRNGMLLDAARSDARRRFGDFEKSYQACRRASQGFRAILQRLHSLVVFTLAAAVVYLASTLWQAQASFDARIHSLQAHIDAHSTMRPAKVAAKIPLIQWRPPSLPATQDMNRQKSSESLIVQFAANRMQQPWSDWKILDDDPAQPR